MSSTESSAISAPRWSVLLPLAYCAHLAEEWWGGPGFFVWAHAVLGVEVSHGRFILINTVAFSLLTVGTVQAIRDRRFAWFAVTFSALLFLNGALHLVATVGFATYSPGTVTGTLLYLPLGGLLLRHMSRRLPGQVYALAVLAGIVAHVLVAIAAFA